MNQSSDNEKENQEVLLTSNRFHYGIIGIMSYFLGYVTFEKEDLDMYFISVAHLLLLQIGLILMQQELLWSSVIMIIRLFVIIKFHLK